MSNMFRDASKKTVTPNIKEEEVSVTLRGSEDEAETASFQKGYHVKPAPKRQKPQIRTGDDADSGSMGAILSGKLAVKPTGGQRSVYLDDEVFAAVEELAEKNGATKSKIINMILRSALFGE